jgi:hypothetical protein
MSNLKFILGAIIFVIIYGLIDLVAGLIPEWVGLVFLASLSIGLMRLAFLIAKEANK